MARAGCGMSEFLRMARSDGRRFVIYDLEYTSWEGAMQRGWSGPREHRELVQIGAARVRFAVRGGAPVLVEEAVLSVLARPLCNLTLSRYFSELTGITQAELDATGVHPQAALRAFGDFVGAGSAFSFGADSEVIVENIRLNGLHFEGLQRLSNIRPFLLGALNLPAETTSGSIARRLGGVVVGRGEHDALYDVRSICVGVATALGCGLATATALNGATVEI